MVFGITKPVERLSTGYRAKTDIPLFRLLHQGHHDIRAVILQDVGQFFGGHNAVVDVIAFGPGHQVFHMLPLPSGRIMYTLYFIPIVTKRKSDGKKRHETNMKNIPQTLRRVSMARLAASSRVSSRGCRNASSP